MWATVEMIVGLQEEKVYGKLSAKAGRIDYAGDSSMATLGGGVRLNWCCYQITSFHVEVTDSSCSAPQSDGRFLRVLDGREEDHTSRC